MSLTLYDNEKKYREIREHPLSYSAKIFGLGNLAPDVLLLQSFVQIRNSTFPSKSSPVLPLLLKRLGLLMGVKMSEIPPKAGLVLYS